MKVSRELIEKYHDGLCTAEEKIAVEAWLLDDTSAPLAPLPAGESKFKIQDDIWKGIAPIIPARKEPAIITFFRPFNRQVAAVALLALAGVVGYYLKEQSRQSALIVIKNASETVNKQLHESAYTISIGPKSNVAINNETGKIDFCGAMMINPKRDIEFTIQGTCTKPDEKVEKMLLKKGQNYIALHYGSAANPDEVIILPKTSLDGLPPLVQRQLMMQFNI